PWSWPFRRPRGADSSEATQRPAESRVGVRMCGLDARGRCHQARHVCAREKNGAAAVRALAVAAGGDVEVAPVRAAEAEARHERRGHRQHALEPAVGAEARDAAPPGPSATHTPPASSTASPSGLPRGMRAKTRRLTPRPSSARSCARTTPSLYLER